LSLNNKNIPIELKCSIADNGFSPSVSIFPKPAQSRTQSESDYHGQFSLVGLGYFDLPTVKNEWNRQHHWWKSLMKVVFFEFQNDWD
jgi:hypothetical protein